MTDDAGAVRRTPRPAREELDRALIRRAIADPGAVVAARWPEESVPAWSARAVEQTLLDQGWQRRPVVLLRAEDCACPPPYADCPHGPEPVDALDLAVWLHAEAAWRVAGFDAITVKLAQINQKVTAERVALQARNDAARRLVAEHGADEYPPANRLLSRLIAALDGQRFAEPVPCQHDECPADWCNEACPRAVTPPDLSGRITDGGPVVPFADEEVDR